jgi:hypothetical protein
MGSADGHTKSNAPVLHVTAESHVQCVASGMDEFCPVITVEDAG